VTRHDERSVDPAFLALAVLQVVTLVVVIGVLRQVLPLLGSAGPAGNDHPHGDGLTATPSVGPAAGTLLPALMARADDGREVTASDLAEGSVVLLFVDEGCAPCRDLTADLRQRQLRLGRARLHPVIDEDADPSHVPSGPGVTVLRQHRGAVAGALASTRCRLRSSYGTVSSWTAGSSPRHHTSKGSSTGHRPRRSASHRRSSDHQPAPGPADGWLPPG
jgi:hypothetical protein